LHRLFGATNTFIPIKLSQEDTISLLDFQATLIGKLVDESMGKREHQARPITIPLNNQ
jgi:hypothetical protein